jgi:4-amino-4-deoxy-L-arabinose transferase-like glycosyltransferase
LAKYRGVLLLLTACLGLRAVALVRPCLSDDEATYCVVGREMLAGRVLYRDVVDHKPPLIYLTYAATQKLGGPVGGMRLLHLLSILVVFATGLLLGRVARRLAIDRGESGLGDPEALAAAFLYVVFSTTLFDFDSLAANCELFMLLPLVGSVLVYLRSALPEIGRAGLFGAGALVGLAMLYKYQAGVQLPLYFIHLAVVHRRRPGQMIQGWLLLVGGTILVIGTCVGVMHIVGDLRDAWFWFRFNFAYIREGLKLSEVAGRAVGRLSYAIIPALLLWWLGARAAEPGKTRPVFGGLAPGERAGHHRGRALLWSLLLPGHRATGGPCCTGRGAPVGIATRSGRERHGGSRRGVLSHWRFPCPRDGRGWSGGSRLRGDGGLC